MSAPAPDVAGTGTDGGSEVTVARGASGARVRGTATRFFTLRLRSAGAPAGIAADDAGPSLPGAAAPEGEARLPGTPSGPPPARASPLLRLLDWLRLRGRPGPKA